MVVLEMTSSLACGAEAKSFYTGVLRSLIIKADLVAELHQGALGQSVLLLAEVFHEWEARSL